MAAAVVSSSSFSRQTSTKMNPDLQKERRKATFNLLELTNILDGGKENTERRREIESMVFSDPEFEQKPTAFMTPTERYSASIKRNILAVKKLKDLNITDNQEVWWFKDAVHGNEEVNLTLHTSMFLHTVYTQMTEEQHEIWLNAIFDFTIIGTYAQTEMGHGTYLRGLETTATYDPSTQEFVLHSPTLTSLKWWPGNLGKTVTHAIVAAKLITQGQDVGTHMFMVQLRSLEDHKPLPGVELGDIGPKFGFTNIDNGFLRLSHVRIPRDQMCMKHAQVLPSGKYAAPSNSKLSYGSMVVIRSFLIELVGKKLSRGCTIATRYSAVRRQSELQPGQREPIIMEYQSQQMKLFPSIATAYALLITGAQLKARYFEYLAVSSEGDFSGLPELHGTTAGVKAFTTEAGRQCMEVLRMACGGHGYSAASGFPELYGNLVAACTYEGENTVMALQTARFLMKIVRQGGNIPAESIMSYLNEPGTRCNARRKEDFQDINVLLRAYRRRAQRVVLNAFERLKSDQQRGMAQPIAWNQNHIHLIRASNAHCHYYVLDSFHRGVEAADCSVATKQVLRTLVEFYAVYGLLENKGEVLLSGFLNPDQFDLLDQGMVDLLERVRPNAVALVDAFDIHDIMLQSVLGRNDGNVYENLYKWAKASPLNEKDVPDVYHEAIRPFLQENRQRVASKL